MPNTKEEIIDAVVTFINREHSVYINWYVGITANPAHRIFTDHCFPKTDPFWIHREADSPSTARATVQQLIGMGFDGTPEVEDLNAQFVYAYKKYPGITKP